MKRTPLLALVALLCIFQPALAVDGSRSTRQSWRQSYGSHPYQAASSRHGRSHRSTTARRAFMMRTGHPQGWEGHIVDHIVPLACGGADDPSNMQWQTVEEAKAKDKWERKSCT